MSYQAVRIRSSSFSHQQQQQLQQEKQTKQTGSRSASREDIIETRPSAPSIQRRKSSDNAAATTTRTQRSRRNSSVVVEAKNYSIVSPSDNNDRVEGDEEDPVNSILNGLDVIKALVESFENTLAKASLTYSHNSFHIFPFFHILIFPPIVWHRIGNWFGWIQEFPLNILNR